jgi:hypothetical protein
MTQSLGSEKAWIKKLWEQVQGIKIKGEGNANLKGRISCI